VTNDVPDEPTRSLSDAPTLIPALPGSASGSESDAHPGIMLMEGSSPRLSHETQSLLRVRLRAATLILFAVLAVFFVLSFRRPTASPWIPRLVVVAVLGMAFALVASRRPVSLRQLRVVEIVVFGVLLVQMGTSQYVRIDRTLGPVEQRLNEIPREQGDPNVAMSLLEHTQVKAAARGLTFGYFAVMLIYGMFIPNTWRRAAVVVAPMVVVPMVLVLILALQHPHVARQVATDRDTFDPVTTMAGLLVGAALAVYGTHVINTLRTEAFEAKRLGRYQLTRRIGTGGMGEVYLAEHQLLKRPCAIKLIRPERVGHPNALARFEREVRATAKLSHWNTVEIYDYGHTDDGTFYYVMEFLPGLSLAELIQRFGPMPPERVIHLLRQTCHALGEAHAAGLIHRDIKPGNIFAAQRGGVYDVAKLLDFGLVKPMADAQTVQLTQIGTIAGSLLYISPEQALGDLTPSQRSDIYSMGAVAYRLLTGQPPFQGKTASRLVVAHARDAVVPPSQLRPDVPADLEQVVLHCLQKDPDDRYQDAASLEAALGACQDAGKWTQERAVAWWAEFGQAPPPPSAPAPEPPPEQA